MTKRLYVGNLPFQLTTEELATLFEAWGPVAGADIVRDHATGESRGFGFVQLPEEQVPSAIQALHGSALRGRPLVVNEARPRETRPGERPPVRPSYSPRPYSSNQAPPSTDRSDSQGRPSDSQPGGPRSGERSNARAEDRPYARRDARNSAPLEEPRGEHNGAGGRNSERRSRDLKRDMTRRERNWS